MLSIALIQHSKHLKASSVQQSVLKQLNNRTKNTKNTIEDKAIKKCADQSYHSTEIVQEKSIKFEYSSSIQSNTL